MNIQIKIQLPEIWNGEFTKDEWGSINYIVGANGTGKTLLSNKLKEQLQVNQYKVRLLSADRLAGLERNSYSYNAIESGNEGFKNGLNISRFNNILTEGEERGLSASAFVILKKRLDVRIKIEALLSDMFKKTIRLVEEGGYLKPKMQNIKSGVEYGLKEQECHGLKEIISLLTFLYDEDYNCIIFDEPELHLHPQFQSFFLNEIRKMAGDPKTEPSKKIFFIITHSPYFIELKTLDDLKNILVCHNNHMPTYIKDDDLSDEQDKYILKKFIPRFNTHHKQFFFSPNPVFVEGYTDQQIITLLFEKAEMNIAASGSCVIDVGGKDELAVFYKLCDKLNIDCRVIADYDALFRGKLREVICSNEKIKQSIIKGGYGQDISNNIGEIERKLLDIGDALITKSESNDSDIQKIISVLNRLYEDKQNNINTIHDDVFLSLYHIKEKIETEIPEKRDDVESILSKHKAYLECIKSGNIFIIPNGELEHFFKATPIDYLNITNKDKLFSDERDSILTIESKEEIEKQYEDILPLLKESVPHVKVDMIKHVKYTIVDWIQKVQSAVSRGEVKDLNTLKTNARVEYSMYSQILDCEDGGFQIKEDGKFDCTIHLKPSMIGEKEKLIQFTDGTTPQNFKLE